MQFRKAVPEDLLRLREVYREIVRNMELQGLSIWDEVYPCVCFAEDIRQVRLYLLEDAGEILSAFALSPTHPGAEQVKWQQSTDRVFYLDRLGVNPAHGRRGLGSLTLREAMALARKQRGDSLRLFVVDSNAPAIALYLKNGFSRAEGVYEQIIDERLALHEFGFEIHLSP